MATKKNCFRVALFFFLGCFIAALGKMEEVNKEKPDESLAVFLPLMIGGFGGLICLIKGWPDTAKAAINIIEGIAGFCAVGFAMFLCIAMPAGLATGTMHMYAICGVFFVAASVFGLLAWFIKDMTKSK